MKIYSLTVCHKVFPIELREKIAFKSEEATLFLSDLKSKHSIDEALLISTCNRTELFIGTDSTHKGLNSLEEVLQIWERERNFKLPICPPPNIVDHHNSVERLLRVTAGLESQIIGESEIQGQVRNAMSHSEDAGVNGPVILKLWEKALRCGKRVRSETPLGDGALSVAYGALEVAKKIFGELSRLNVTIIGAGEVSELVLQNLKGQKTKSLKILNRSLERAEQLAQTHGAELGGLDELPQSLVHSDLIITSTGSNEPLITAEMVHQAQSNRRGRALLLVDLGLPRDVNSEAGKIGDVFLFNLDDLARLVEGNLKTRRAAIPEAEEIVRHEAGQFASWLESRKLDPVDSFVERRTGERRDERTSENEVGS